MIANYFATPGADVKTFGTAVRTTVELIVIDNIAFDMSFIVTFTTSLSFTYLEGPAEGIIAASFIDSDAERIVCLGAFTHYCECRFT
jgi:hypothetical protein